MQPRHALLTPPPPKMLTIDSIGRREHSRLQPRLHYVWYCPISSSELWIMGCGMLWRGATKRRVICIAVWRSGSCYCFCPWCPSQIRQNFYLKWKQYLKGRQWTWELSGHGVHGPHSDTQPIHTAGRAHAVLAVSKSHHSNILSQFNINCVETTVFKSFMETYIDIYFLPLRCRRVLEKR